MRADGRMDGWAVGRVAAVAVLLSGHPAIRLFAQDSQFGIRGLGTPGRFESVRARATGGAFAPFDATSPLVDASLAGIRGLTATLTSGTSWRTAEFGGEEASLRATRFPALVIAGRLSPSLTIAGGFSTYLDRSFGISTIDTVDLRGEPEPVTDEIVSDGGIADVRLALGLRLGDRVAIGASLHRMTGSTRVTATRRFEDSTTYRTSIARDQVAYGGWGGSVSALILTDDLSIAAWARSDSKLRADIGGRQTAEDDLPFGFGGGVEWVVGSRAAVAGAVAWRSWGGADGPPNSYDTFGWSLGAEVGSRVSPVRFGIRGGTMPFGVGEQPTEFAVAVGLGKQFSGGRGRLDFGLERLQRTGGGMTERVWTFLLGLSVRP